MFARFKLNNIEDIFNDFPVLEMEDFLLRKITKNDYSDIIEIYQNKDIAIYDRALYISSEKDAEIFLNQINEAFKEKKRIDWGIEDKVSGKLIGLIGLSNISIVDSRGEIGYVLNKDFTNKGIMKYVLKWLVDFCFNFMGLHKIEANINTKNTASVKVCENAGFTMEGLRKAHNFNKRTGTYNDVYIYSLLNKKWDIIIEKYN